MRYTAKYLTYTFMCKTGLKRNPAVIVRHVRNKNTLSFLINAIIRHFPAFIASTIEFALNDFHFNDAEQFAYRYKTFKGSKELIIMPSYCEKPVQCPDRYELKCRGMNGQCSLNCRFKAYPGFSDNTVHYRFMTHDNGVAEIVAYALKQRSMGKRIFAVMSMCRFADDISAFFPLFGITLLRLEFSQLKGQCKTVESFFNGDMGRNFNQNNISFRIPVVLEHMLSVQAHTFHKV